MKKNVFLTMLMLLLASLNAQDKSNSIINYAPNSNFFAVKIKNAKDIKTKLENHPLKKLIYNDKTKEIFEDLINLKSHNEEEEDKEKDKELEKLEDLSLEKFMSSLNGELLLTVNCENFQEIDDEKNTIFALILQVDHDLFQEFIKLNISIEEKSEIKKSITKNQFENIEYVTISEENDIEKQFFAESNGIAVISNNETVFKKILNSIAKKTNFENGLRSNEKIYSYFSKNQNKDFLGYCDMSQIFETLQKEDETPTNKEVLKAMKFEKMFELNLSFDLNEKADSIDFVLKGLDDGFMQYITFVNNEFTPSAFVSADISGYSRIFFSVSELKKKFIALLIKIDPNFSTNYQMVSDMAKTNFQIDIDGFFDSIGDDLENINYLKDKSEDENFFISKLKNPSVFITNLSSMINNPKFKQGLETSLSVTETKEVGSQFWSLAAKNTLPNQKPVSFALGNFDSYAFAASPAKMAQKYIALTKKSAESKLTSLASYNNARAMFPNKIALFSFSKTKDMISSIKTKIMDQKEVLKLIPNTENIIKLLEEINPDDFKGNLSFGLWKDTNQINMSLKLISTEK